MGIFSTLFGKRPLAQIPRISFTSRGEQFLLTDGSAHYFGDCVWGGVHNDRLTIVADTIRRTDAAGHAVISLTDREQDDIATQAKLLLDSAGHNYRVVISRRAAEA